MPTCVAICPPFYLIKSINKIVIFRHLQKDLAYWNFDLNLSNGSLTIANMVGFILTWKKNRGKHLV